MKGNDAAEVLAGFWMGGYEGADHVNAAGLPLDLTRMSGHLGWLEVDHRNAADAGIACIRESVGWRITESSNGAIDSTRIELIASSARKHGLQVLWTLLHYGIPADLSLHDDRLIGRFARFAARVARVIADSGELAPVFTPVNEIGFLSWAAAQNDHFAHPNCAPDDVRDAATGRVRDVGYDVKRRLVSCEIAAIDAIRAVAPRARFLHVEPLVHVVAPLDRPDLHETARDVGHWQWQTWDMLAGRCEPQLGGSAAYLDLLGVNHYEASQWELGSCAPVRWSAHDARRRPLAKLLGHAWNRYGRPLLLAETGHVGVGRGPWLSDTAAQVRSAIDQGVPVLGICLYPLVDRPDWADPSQWHASGLWDVRWPDESTASHAEAAGLIRTVDPEYLATLESWQRRLGADTRSVRQRDSSMMRAGTIGRAFDQRPAGERPADEHPADKRPADKRPAIVVFSHLRWDFVRHRSWQLFNRLARRWRVIYVEEPLATRGAARVDCHWAGPQLAVLTPCDVDLDQGADPKWSAARGSIMSWLQANAIDHPIVWLTTPMAWPLGRSLPRCLTVYDCADELAGFMNAPTTLSGLERELLAHADLILAAGPSLARARGTIAPGRIVECRNAVDLRRFAVDRPANTWAGREAAVLSDVYAQRGQPVLGFAGVVDERFDLALFGELVAQHPQWQFVVVGPILKIDPASVPRSPNLHWLGEQPWALLPDLFESWDVGLIPFAINPATRSAYPLKVLEYLAADLPVVSVPLADLVSTLTGQVHFAVGSRAFGAACEHALATSRPRSQRSSTPLSTLVDWESVTLKIDACLEHHLEPTEHEALCP